MLNLKSTPYPMKSSLILFVYLFTFNSLLAQVKSETSEHFKLIEGSENSNSYRVELSSEVDTTWNKWQQKGYFYGLDPKITPMFTNIEGIISTPYMIQVRGNDNEKNKKRWGFHVFEGYAKDDKSRITMLVNKHIEEGKPVAEMYYYSPLWGHSDSAYNWFRIGSDVRQHSFLFGRDRALFYGSLELTNTLTLGRISQEDLREDKPEGDDEQNYEESAKHVNYMALKNADDGSMFYDKDHQMVVIKIDGTWMKLKVEALPDDISYDF